MQDDIAPRPDSGSRNEHIAQINTSRRETSTLGILGLCFFWVPIVGLVLGIISLAIRERKKAFGILAIVLSILGPVLFLSLGVLSAIAIPRFGSVRTQAEQSACRSNMRSLASAEAMFYGMNDEYGTISELASSGVMENANLVECPTSGEGYSCTASTTTYTIRCTNSAHGSIVDGHTSWQ